MKPRTWSQICASRLRTAATSPRSAGCAIATQTAWSAEYGIHVIWNLLYGFPGETRVNYEETLALLPSLVHLAPPSLSQLALYRFSPYFEEPRRHGLRLERPLDYYGLLFPLEPERLADLAQSFEYSHLDGRAPGEHVLGVREEIERWQSDSAHNFGALTYRRGPDFLSITDTRTTTANGAGVLRYELDTAESQVHLACDAGAKPEKIQTHLEAAVGRRLPAKQLEDLLFDLVEERLMMRDGGKYLSLALPNR